MKRIYSLMALTVFAFLFYASKVSRVSYDAKSYAAVTRPESREVTSEYIVPQLTLVDNIKQLQKKGGVTISCEFVPFKVERGTKREEVPYYANPEKPGYDVIQIADLPSYSVSPNALSFNLRIKNSMERLLKLRDVALVMFVDGKQYSWPTGFYSEEWAGGMIMSTIEKNQTLPGPTVESLSNAKVINIFLNDMPVAYDAAGNVTKRENFEWTFTAVNKKEVKTEKVQYIYEERPWHKERCSSCAGKGRIIATCTRCKGAGRYTGYDGKVYACSVCNSTGKAEVNCNGCNGQGQIAYPKSKNPAITSSVRWNGHWVDVVTKPAGANIKVIDPDTRQYVTVNRPSNVKVKWYYTGNTKEPIIVEYGGQEVKVLPYKNGKESRSIMIDFTKGSPVVKTGEQMN